MAEKPDYLTPKEISEELRVSSSTVKRWIQRQELEGVQIGKLYRIARSAFCRFVREHTIAHK